MARVVLFLLAAAAIAGGAAAYAASPQASQARPSLRLVDRAPMTFRGTSFKPRERVRVVVVAASGTATRLVRASSTGAFAVVYRGLPFDPCLEARAVGQGGSRAWFKLPERFCPIPPDGE